MPPASHISEPMFYLNDNFVIQVQEKDGNQVLAKYDIANRTVEDLAVLPVEFDFQKPVLWTKNGLLVLAGLPPHSKNSEQNTSRLIILDVQNKRIIYASPALPPVIRILELADNS